MEVEEEDVVVVEAQTVPEGSHSKAGVVVVADGWPAVCSCKQSLCAWAEACTAGVVHWDNCLLLSLVAVAAVAAVVPMVVVAAEEEVLLLLLLPCLLSLVGKEALALWGRRSLCLR